MSTERLYAAMPYLSLALLYGNAVYFPMHTVIETRAYLADAAKIGLSRAQLSAIVDIVARDPSGGDLIQGSGGARKRRIALAGGGKSSGLRLIVAYRSATLPAILLRIYAKSKASNLSKSDVTALKRGKE
ncbi:MAG: type II toxin-antitoxin system RelE/ParE family toxin [Pseudomonadota bacterium]